MNAPVTAAIIVASVRDQNDFGSYPPVGIDGNGNVRIFYLSTAPSLFVTIAQRLGRQHALVIEKSAVGAVQVFED